MKQFASLKELETFINEYQRRNQVQLWKRDARNIDTMRKICPNKLKFCNSDLKYYSITYSCSKGGRKFEPKGTGLRNSSTTKENCNMHIKLKLSPDGQKLQIASLHEIHNHVTETLQIRNIKGQMYQCKNRKSVHESNKSSPLHNLKLINSKRNIQFSNLENLFKFLNVDNNIVHIAVDNDNKLLGIYYQTQWMKKCFAGYPELLGFEMIYTLSHLDMLVYMMMSVNGNNEGDPIAFFVINEDSDVISHMLQVFKEQNPKWPSLNTIVTDQDSSENSILRKEFPHVSHDKSMFYLEKRFRIGISTMDIETDEREKCIGIFKKITSSKSMHEYSRLYAELMSLNIENISNYYNNNWHGTRQEWVECYRNKNLIFGVNIRNHIESFHEKMKHVCNKFDNLTNFFENLNNLLDNLQSERNQTAELMLAINNVANEKNTREINYMKIFTPHAYELVYKNLQNIPNFNIIHHETHFKVISQEYPEEEYRVDFQTDTCTCPFYTANYLLCPHMCAVNSIVKRDSYNEKLVHRRHLKSKYINTFKNSSQEKDTFESLGYNDRTLTTLQKYETTISKCKQIASILANMNCAEFMHHSKQLDTLIKHWRLRRETKICLTDTVNTAANDQINCDPVVTEQLQSDKEILESTEELETSEINEELEDTMDDDADMLLEVETEEVFEETENLTEYEEILDDEVQISETVQYKNDYQFSKMNEDKLFPRSRCSSLRKRREQNLRELDRKKCKKI